MQGTMVLGETREVRREQVIQHFILHHKSLNFILRLEAVMVALKQGSDMI